MVLMIRLCLIRCSVIIIAEEYREVVAQRYSSPAMFLQPTSDSATWRGRNLHLIFVCGY